MNTNIKQTLRSYRREYSVTPTKSNAEVGDDGKRANYDLDDGTLARIMNAGTFDNAARGMKVDLLELMWDRFFPGKHISGVMEKYPEKYPDGHEMAGEPHEQAGRYVRPNEARLWVAIVETLNNYFEV